jgi:hypothetical protein
MVSALPRSPTSAAVQQFLDSWIAQRRFLAPRATVVTVRSSVEKDPFVEKRHLVHAPFVQLQRQDISGRHHDRGHSVVLVAVGQAVDPRVHVPAVEAREAQSGREGVVKAVPVVNPGDRNIDDRHDVNATAGRLAQRQPRR